MIDFIINHRPEIEKNIRIFFKKEKSHKFINNWHDLAISKLENLVLKGKLLRGCFVILGSAVTSKKLSPNVFKLAAAIEIFHTAFLIHDDIMDQEKIRRGEDSINEQFKKLALREKLNQPELFGQSMAINTGDIAIFLGLKALNSLNLESKTKNDMSNLLIEEMIKLGAAQMQDVYFGLSEKKVSEEQIMDVYMYKTARYSFVMPLKLGMLLSDYKDIKIEKLGELLGLIYQIKDDEINLFSDTKVSGKSKGSDLNQKKKTLFYKYLVDNIDASDLKKLNSILSSPNISEQHNKALNKLILKTNSKKLVNQKVQAIALEYKKVLNSANLSQDTKSVFENLLQYSLDRQK